MKRPGTRTIILIITFLLGLLSFLFDKRISSFFHTLNNPFFDKIINLSLYIQIPGIFMGLIILIAAIIFFFKKDKSKWIIRIISSFVFTSIIAFVIKELINRPRPWQVLGLQQPSIEALGSSFPSAHAAVVFAMLPFFEKEYPKLKYLWIVFALIICFVRIYLPIHYLSDILLGALMGYLIGHVLCNLKKPNRKSEKK